MTAPIDHQCSLQKLAIYEQCTYNLFFKNLPLSHYKAQDVTSTQVIQRPTDISGGKLHQIRINWQQIMSHALGIVLEGLVQRMDERNKIKFQNSCIHDFLIMSTEVLMRASVSAPSRLQHRMIIAILFRHCSTVGCFLF